MTIDTFAAGAGDVRGHAGAALRAVFERILGYGTLLFASVMCIFPFFWMITNSLKEDGELYAFPPSILPATPIWQNYVDAVDTPEFTQQLVNSLVYALGSTLTNVIFCSLAGFALARLEFRGRTLVFGLVLGLLMVPAQSQIIPVFLIIQKLPFLGGNDWLGQGGSGLLNTYWGIILPTAATPFGIFLMRQFFSRIPVEYQEAARLDGAGTFTIFWRIMFPLARPAVAVLSIMSFQAAWNDFVWPLILTSSNDMATLQMGLQLMQSGHDARWNVVMAMATIITMPVILVYILSQRYVVGNAVASGVKG